MLGPLESTSSATTTTGDPIPSAPDAPSAPPAPQFIADVFDEQTRAKIQEVKITAAELRKVFLEEKKIAKTKKGDETAKGAEPANVAKARMAYDQFRSEQYKPYQLFRRQFVLPLGREISSIKEQKIPEVTRKLAESKDDLVRAKKAIEEKRKRLLDHKEKLEAQSKAGMNVTVPINKVTEMIRSSASTEMIEALNAKILLLEENAKNQIAAYEATIEELKAEKELREKESAPLKAIYGAVPALPKKVLQIRAPEKILPIKEWLAPNGPLTDGLYVENLRDFLLFRDETLPGNDHILPLIPTRGIGGKFEEVTLAKAYQNLATNPDFTLDTLVAIASGRTVRVPGTYCITRTPERLDAIMQKTQTDETANDLFGFLKLELMKEEDPKAVDNFNQEELKTIVEQGLEAADQQIKQANFMEEDTPGSDKQDKGKDKEKECVDTTQINTKFSLKDLEEQLKEKEKAMGNYGHGALLQRGAGKILSLEEENAAFVEATQRFNQAVGNVDKLVEKLQEMEQTFKIEAGADQDDSDLTKRAVKVMNVAMEMVSKKEEEAELARALALSTAMHSKRVIENVKTEVALENAGWKAAVKLQEEEKLNLVYEDLLLAHQLAQEEKRTAKKATKEVSSSLAKIEREAQEKATEKMLQEEARRLKLEQERATQKLLEEEKRRLEQEERAKKETLSNDPVQIINKEVPTKGVTFALDHALKAHRDANDGRSPYLNQAVGWGRSLKEPYKSTYEFEVKKKGLPSYNG